MNFNEAIKTESDRICKGEIDKISIPYIQRKYQLSYSDAMNLKTHIEKLMENDHSIKSCNSRTHP